MALILVVDDDVLVRNAIVRALLDRGDVEVVSANTVAEAERLIRSEPPDLLVCDLCLPDGLGSDLQPLMARLGTGAPTIFVSAFLSDCGTTGRHGPGVLMLEKPFSDAQLLDAVETAIGARADDPGGRIRLSAIDYAALAVGSRYSVVIDVDAAPPGGGWIAIHQGEIWAASDGSDADAEGAFVRLCNVRARRVVCRRPDSDLPARGVFTAGPELLARARRARADEADVHAGVSPVTTDSGELAPVADAFWPEPVSQDATEIHRIDFGSEDEPVTSLVATIGRLLPKPLRVRKARRTRREGPEETPSTPSPAIPATATLGTPHSAVAVRSRGGDGASESDDPVFEALRDRMADALLRGDRATALEACRLALEQRPDDPLLAANLKRLERIHERR